MRLRTLIVDDEKPARDKIRFFLDLDSEIEVIGECETGSDALAFIRRHHPDLLFLDVQMPMMDGFALLRRSEPERPIAVVFVTAYDKYAVKAFETNAADYLLKPFTRRRFEDALRKVKEQLLQKARSAAKPKEERYLERLAIKTDHGIVFLRSAEIDWIESGDNYVMVHSGKQVHLLRETISTLERALDPGCFLRIHRRFLVNVDRIQELRRQHPANLTLHNGTILPVSRRLKEKVIRCLIRKIT